MDKSCHNGSVPGGDMFCTAGAYNEFELKEVKLEFDFEAKSAIMDEDWAPILKQDCLFSSVIPIHDDSDDFHLTSLDDAHIKKEPQEEASDYQGSSSGSPSSSLSSPDMKEQLGVDLSFCMPFHSGPFLHSPASSSGSPFTMMFPSCNGGAQTSPLPPVSHFSQALHQQQPINQVQQGQDHLHQQMTYGVAHDGLYLEDDGSPSPPVSDCSSSPMETTPSMMNMMYDSMPGSFISQGAGVCNGLTAAQHHLKSRSKMHEMAVKQRLITDQLQDPRSAGTVQLSAEERRTLIQEGYVVPTRLPLSKSDEEALKIVRRKIKNKLSAQESRRKRKEYMDTLEQRCQGYYAENTQLKGRVRNLENTNKQLAAQLKKLQDMIASH